MKGEVSSILADGETDAQGDQVHCPAHLISKGPSKDPDQGSPAPSPSSQAGRSWNCCKSATETRRKPGCPSSLVLFVPPLSSLLRPRRFSPQSHGGRWSQHPNLDCSSPASSWRLLPQFLFWQHTLPSAALGCQTPLTWPHS